MHVQTYVYSTNALAPADDYLDIVAAVSPKRRAETIHQFQS